jgi:hypothetical protein
MSALRQTFARLVSFFRKQELDRDFDQELSAHIELATQDHVQQGMTLPEARRLAIIKLGGVEPSKELHRDSRGLPALDGILQDVRFAFRALRRSPGFALTAIATLAIGIGINAAVFTVTKAALFSGFPMVENNDRVLYLSGGGCCVSWIGRRRRNRSLEWRLCTACSESSAIGAVIRRASTPPKSAQAPFS